MKRSLILLYITVLTLFSCNKMPDTVKVESIAFEAASIELEEGETARLEVNVSPSNADTQKLVWTSSDPTVATVANGSVTALKKGTTTITAEDGDKTASCKVIVNTVIDGLELDMSNLTLYEGKEQTLIATLNPEDASNRKISWSSSDESVATVDNHGRVTAVKSGHATITAATWNGARTAICEVTVKLASPLTFTAAETSTISLKEIGHPDPVIIEYSKGNSPWTSYTMGGVIDLSAGESVSFRAGETGNATFSQNSMNYYQFSMTGSVASSGDIMSLLDQSMHSSTVPEFAFFALFHGCAVLTTPPELTATSLSPHCYRNMFSGCYSLTEAPELPARTLESFCYSMMFLSCRSLAVAPVLRATELADQCYGNMFQGCSSLTEAPSLPATNLTNNCYGGMFWDCTSLTNAPELPAKDLAYNCYSGMFRGCSSLTSAPDLPAAAAVASCYYQMFQGCKSLTKAPELPATYIEGYCYYEMFKGCSKLTKAPALPAKDLAHDCYAGMFSGCSSLLLSPELPAREMKVRCYYAMFSGCTGLTYAPDLPSSTLDLECYRAMFSGCTNLMTAPVLPAMDLTEYCYCEMFKGCSSLTAAPDLSASILSPGCYTEMFSGCSKLNYVKMLATENILYSNSLLLWLSGVSPTGTFVKNARTTWNVRGESGIPEGWTIRNN